MNKPSSSKKVSRRDFLRFASLGASAATLAACAPQVIEKTIEIEKEVVVTEIVEVEKEKIVEVAAATPTKYSGEKAFIRFLTQETDPLEIETYRMMIADFEDQNPDIRIEMDVTGPDQIYEKMAAALSAGATTLDVLQPNPAMAFLLASKGLVLPIDNIVEELGGESFFYDNSVLKWDGKAYGVPFGGGTGQIWYRKDYFEQDGIEIPTTWEDFAEVSKHFTKKFNPNSPTEYGACLSYNKHQSADFFATPFWWSNGAEHFDKDLNLVFDSPETEEFLEWYASLREFSPEGATGYAWGDFINTFLAGQVAMSFYLGRVLGRLYSNAPELLDKVGVFDYPKRKLLVTVDDPNYYIINGNTKFPEQCKRWLKFTLSSKWANEFLCAVPAHLPPATKSQEEWWNQDVTGCKMLDDNIAIKDAFGKSVEYAYNPITNSGGILEAVAQGKDTYFATGVPNPFMATVQSTNNFFPMAIQLMAVEGKTARQAIDTVVPLMENAVNQTKKDVGWEG